MPKTGLSPEQLRSRALDIALTQMREFGFKKVRLSNVAKEIGISHATLYDYFENKEALLDAVIQRWLVEIDIAVDLAVSNVSDPEMRLKTWFLVTYREKRSRALSDPEPYKAYDNASLGGKEFAQKHIRKLKNKIELLANEANLGSEFEAELMLLGMRNFLDPSIIAAQADMQQEEKLSALLDILIAGLKQAK